MGPQNAELMGTVTLKIEDRIDHMLNNPWARDLPVFGDMTDEYNASTALLGKTGQFLSASSDLRHSSRRGAKLIRPKRLNGVDNYNIRLLCHKAI